MGVSSSLIYSNSSSRKTKIGFYQTVLIPSNAIMKSIYLKYKKHHSSLVIEFLEGQMVVLELAYAKDPNTNQQSPKVLIRHFAKTPEGICLNVLEEKKEWGKMINEIDSYIKENSHYHIFKNNCNNFTDHILRKYFYFFYLRKSLF